MNIPDQDAGAPEQVSLRQLLHATSWPMRLLLAFALLLPACLAGWFSWLHYQNVVRETEEAAQRSVVALQAHAATMIETHELILLQIYGSTRGQSWQTITNDLRLQRTMADLISRIEQIAAIGLADANGRLQAGSGDLNLNDSVATQDFFLAHKKGKARGMIFSQPYTGLNGERRFAISIARTDAVGRFDGVIFTSVPIPYFTRFWKQFVPARGYLVPMVREDGVLLARYPAENNPARLDADGPFLTQIRNAPEGVFTARSRVDGVERINAYARIETSPLYISYSIETGNVARKWRNDMIPGFVMALLVTLSLTALCLLVIRQSHRQRAATSRWRAIANDLKVEVGRRESAEDALRQGQKMESLGQLASGIAHDFNNLLAGVVGNLQMMRVHLDHGHLDAVSRAIAAAESVADTATAITQRLLAFSRRQVFSPSAININDRVVIMHDMLQRTVGEHIAIQLTLAPDLWETLCDPNQLDTMLLNLAINARDAMPDGGALRFITENLQRNDASSVVAVDATIGDYVVVSVIDTGAGMPPEVLARALDPFFTTKPAGQGTGLGLSMIHGFVREAGGEVKMTSSVGQGTAVRIYLPRLEIAAPVM
jgi:two-component system NtrC family sensor kinase